MLDKFRPHRKNVLRALLAAAGLEVWFLPKYSPWFMPMEKVFLITHMRCSARMAWTRRISRGASRRACGIGGRNAADASGSRLGLDAPRVFFAWVSAAASAAATNRFTLFIIPSTECTFRNRLVRRNNRRRMMSAVRVAKKWKKSVTLVAAASFAVGGGTGAERDHQGVVARRLLAGALAITTSAMYVER